MKTEKTPEVQVNKALGGKMKARAEEAEDEKVEKAQHEDESHDEERSSKLRQAQEKKSLAEKMKARAEGARDRAKKDLVQVKDKGEQEALLDSPSAGSQDDVDLYYAALKDKVDAKEKEKEETEFHARA